MRIRLGIAIIVVSGTQRAHVVGVSAFTDVFTETDAGWRLPHAVSIDESESSAPAPKR